MCDGQLCHDLRPFRTGMDFQAFAKLADFSRIPVMPTPNLLPEPMLFCFFSWYVSGPTFSTLFAENDEDVKTVQSLMRHANSNIPTSYESFCSNLQMSEQRDSGLS